MAGTTRKGTEHERLGDALDVRLADGRQFTVMRTKTGGYVWARLECSEVIPRPRSGWGFPTALAAYRAARLALSGGLS